MIVKRAAFFLALIFTGPAARALTLPDCLKLAEDRSPLAAQARAVAVQASEVYREALASNLPLVTAQGSVDKSDDPTTQLPDANKAVVHLDQPLTPFSREWALAGQRKVEMSAADLETLQALRDIDRRVRQLYFGILQALQAVRNIDEVRGELGKLMTAVLPRYTMGRAPSFDLLKVKLAIADLEKSRGDQEALLVGQMSELSQTLAMGATTQLDLSAMSASPPVPAPDQVERLLYGNPGLKALAERIEAARLGITAARREWLPELVGSAEYGWAGQTTSDVLTGWDLSATLRLPLFTSGAVSARIAQQKANARVAAARSIAEQQSLLALAFKTRAQAEVDWAQAERLRKLLPDTRQVALAQIERYRRGATGILEATDAVNLRLTTLLDERASYYAYLSDLTDLIWLEGRGWEPNGL